MNRRWYTESLFWETNHDYEAILPVFSLYQDIIDQDGHPLINCRKTFLAQRDPTGYKWAMAYLTEWAHWKALMKNEWFRTALEAWQTELDLLLQAEAIAIIDKIASSGSQSAFQAAKYLASLEHRKGSGGRGRPSKAEISGELKRAVTEAAETADDYNRVFGAPPLPTEGQVN